MKVIIAFWSIVLLHVCNLANGSFLPAVNNTIDLLLTTNNGTSIPPDIGATAFLTSGYHYTIPNTHVSLHLNIPTPRTPLPGPAIIKCLNSFADQLKLHPKDYYLDRLRSCTAGDVQALIAPVKGPLSAITFGDTWRVFVALWGFMNEEGLLFEMKYGVFDGGRMVAWGRLLLVDGLVVPLTSVEEDLVGLPMGVVERSV